MKNKIYFLLVLLPILWNSTSLLAQEETKKEVEESKWAVQFNVQHQDIMFQNLLNFGTLRVFDQVNIRPVYSLEAQRYFSVKPKSKRFLAAQVGYFNSLYHQEWFMAKLAYARERTIYKGLFVSLRAEFGITRIKDNDPQYIYENEKWVVTDNFGAARTGFLFGSRLDIGYRVTSGTHPIEALLITQGNIHFDQNIGALPYYGIGIGVRYGL